MSGRLQRTHGLPRLPSSRAGRWAIGFAGVALVALAVAQVIVIVRQTSAGEARVGDLARNLGPVIGVIFGVSGLGALVASSIAIFHARERTVAVYAAFAYGLLVLALLIGEVAVPH